MDCEERDRLTAIYREAVQEWTEAGGTAQSKQNDPKVVAAQAKMGKAKQAAIDHRTAHGCWGG